MKWDLVASLTKLSKLLAVLSNCWTKTLFAKQEEKKPRVMESVQKMKRMISKNKIQKKMRMILIMMK